MTMSLYKYAPSSFLLVNTNQLAPVEVCCWHLDDHFQLKIGLSLKRFPKYYREYVASES